MSLKMKPQISEKIEIPQGKHTGVIAKIENRTTPYNYTDIFIKVDGLDATLKVGYPTILQVTADKKPASKLASVLVRLGLDINKEVDLEKAVGLKVEFVSFDKISEKNGNTYATIAPESVKKL